MKVNGESLEGVEEFKYIAYLGVILDKRRKCENEVENRVTQIYKGGK